MGVVSGLESVKVHLVFRKQQEVRHGYHSCGSEKWMWPSQRQMVTSLIVHGKELPWTVFISSWCPGDGARQKRDMSKFGCWEVSSLQVRYPLQGFQRLSNPWRATWRDGELSPFQAPWWFPSGRTSSAPRVTHATFLFLHLRGSDSPCPFRSGNNLLAQSSGQLKDPAPFLLALNFPTAPRSRGLTPPNPQRSSALMAKSLLRPCNKTFTPYTHFQTSPAFVIEL